jgi:aminoglycoside phosphotransferase (APT) family kinase protein
VKIDEDLVHRLIGAQFPQWADLKVEAVTPGGWDNRTFRLGERMLVRLPSDAAYSSQVAREQRWLPHLAPSLPVPIPTPIAMGQPDADYPWPWSVFTWLDGQPAEFAPYEDQTAFASDIASFLTALHRIDASDGPLPGTENFFRGGRLEIYDTEVQRAIEVLAKTVDASACTAVWHAGLGARWNGERVWVHGDFSAGNLLLTDARLCGVIDFGQCCVGDPACDLTVAWTLLDERGRHVFRTALQADAGTWARARAWALWKCLIVAAGLAETYADEKPRAWPTLQNVLAVRPLE